MKRIRVTYAAYIYTIYFYSKDTSENMRTHGDKLLHPQLCSLQQSMKLHTLYKHKIEYSIKKTIRNCI